MAELVTRYTLEWSATSELDGKEISQSNFSVDGWANSVGCLKAITEITPIFVQELRNLFKTLEDAFKKASTSDSSDKSETRPEPSREEYNEALASFVSANDDDDDDIVLDLS